MIYNNVTSFGRLYCSCSFFSLFYALFYIFTSLKIVKIVYLGLGLLKYNKLINFSEVIKWLKLWRPEPLLVTDSGLVGRDIGDFFFTDMSPTVVELSSLRTYLSTSEHKQRRRNHHDHAQLTRNNLTFLESGSKCRSV